MKKLPQNSLPATLENAAQLEKDGDFKQAALLYENMLTAAKPDLFILKRLMIVYRKLKNYKKELAVIEKSIKVQQQYYAKHKKIDKAATLLSDKLNVSLGHTDKKGKVLIGSSEIEKLQKRQAVVTKKMAAKTS